MTGKEAEIQHALSEGNSLGLLSRKTSASQTRRKTALGDWSFRDQALKPLAAPALAQIRLLQFLGGLLYTSWAVMHKAGSLHVLKQKTLQLRLILGSIYARGCNHAHVITRPRAWLLRLALEGQLHTNRLRWTYILTQLLTNRTFSFSFSFLYGVFLTNMMLLKIA